jgi:cardiolipin synthase
MLAPMTEMSILVDSAEFWPAFSADLRVARSRVYVQVMTFEGDAAGQGFADLLSASTCSDRRLLVDDYSRYKVSDRFVYRPWGSRDPVLHRELQATLGALEQLRREGVQVEFTNPMGRFLVRYPARNHKKLVVLDDVCYLGGINFSDHNFSWHDMMLRVEDSELADFLAMDVRATCRGIDQRAVKPLATMEVHLLDGRTNEAGYAPVLALIDEAEDSVFVESPYVTYPFLDRLVDARRRGVAVTLVQPQGNNHPTVAAYVARTASRGDLGLRLLPGMIHLKALLIDGRVLVMGSSNFDIVSYRAEQEVVALVTDAAVIREVTRRVIEPDLEASRPATDADPSRRSFLCLPQLRAVEAWALVAARLPKGGL